MANPHRGEVTITIDGTVYTLVLNTEALCVLEERLSTPTREQTFLEILQKAFSGSATYATAVIWAALHKYHPTMTLKEARALVDAAGGPEAFRETLEAAATATQPDPRDLPRDDGHPRAAHVN